MAYDAQWRATFEDTKKRQNELRKFLEECEKNNLYISDEKRGEFFDLLADSLIGLEFDKNDILFLPSSKQIIIKNIGGFIREFSYQTTFITEQFIKKYNDTLMHEKINLSDIWHGLKFIIYSIYPEALQLSAKMSKERDAYNTDQKEMANFGGTKQKKKKSSDTSWSTN